MINPLHIEQGYQYAQYILDNRVSIKAAAEVFGTHPVTTQKRITLLKEHDPECYLKVKTIIDEVKLESLRANKNHICYGRNKGAYRNF